MTRDKLVNWLASQLWLLGLGNTRDDALRQASRIVDELLPKGVLVLNDTDASIAPEREENES